MCSSGYYGKRLSMLGLGWKGSKEATPKLPSAQPPWASPYLLTVPMQALTPEPIPSA